MQISLQSLHTDPLAKTLQLLPFRLCNLQKPLPPTQRVLPHLLADASPSPRAQRTQRQRHARVSPRTGTRCQRPRAQPGKHTRTAHGDTQTHAEGAGKSN